MGSKYYRISENIGKGGSHKAAISKSNKLSAVKVVRRPTRKKESSRRSSGQIHGRLRTCKSQFLLHHVQFVSHVLMAWRDTPPKRFRASWLDSAGVPRRPISKRNGVMSDSELSVCSAPIIVQVAMPFYYENFSARVSPNIFPSRHIVLRSLEANRRSKRVACCLTKQGRSRNPGSFNSSGARSLV